MDALYRRVPHTPFVVERLEQRVMLAVDFALAGTLALMRGSSAIQSLNFYKAAHQPRIRVDEATLEEEQGGEEDPPEVEFDPSVITGPSAPVLAGTIDAINFDQDASTSGFYHIPPDSSGAAGPNHLVNVVNTSIQWYTKAGTQQKNVRFGKTSPSQGSTIVGSFFESLTPLTGTFDPKVVYDQYNGRFVVVSLEHTDIVDGDPANTSRLLIAVSDDSDPNGAWYTTAINTNVTISGVPRWMDYPGLAVDANAIYVTGNMFSFGGAPSFGGSRLWIISKTGLYTGGAPTSTNIYDPSTLSMMPGQNFTMQPTMMYGTGPGTTGAFLVSSGWTNGSAQELLSVIRVTNPLSSPTFSNTFVNAGDISSGGFAAAPQSGSAHTIDAGSTRMYSAMWRNNAIWAANTINPVSGVDAGTATAHWYKISADSATIGSSPADQGNISGEDIAAGTRTFYPAITVDSSNNMGIGFSASGPNIFPGAYYTGRLAGDPAGTVQPAAALATGVASYYRTFQGGEPSRWGDYSSISIDPSDGTTFWLYNEYAMAQGTVFGTLPNETGRWATRFGKFTFINPVSATPLTPDLVGVGTDLVMYDTGVSQTDNITNRDNSTSGSKLQFSVGGTVSGATVTIFADGGAIGSALAAGATTIVTTNGSADLTDGTHSISAKQTESGKSQSLTSGALSIFIDTIAPTVTSSSFQFDAPPQQLIYTFSEDVSATLSSGDITFTSNPVVASPTLAAPVWTAATNKATFDFFPSPIANSSYTATMSAAGVTDVAGNALPANSVLPFFFLAGDGDRNKVVQINDFNILATFFGKSGQPFSNGNYDYSPDGIITITDFNVLATNFGKSVP